MSCDGGPDVLILVSAQRLLVQQLPPQALRLDFCEPNTAELLKQPLPPVERVVQHLCPHWAEHRAAIGIEPRTNLQAVRVVLAHSDVPSALSSIATLPAWSIAILARFVIIAIGFLSIGFVRIGVSIVTAVIVVTIQRVDRRSRWRRGGGGRRHRRWWSNPVGVPTVIAAREEQHEMECVVSTISLVRFKQPPITMTKHNGILGWRLVTQHLDFDESASRAVVAVHAGMRFGRIPLLIVDHERPLWDVIMCAHDLSSTDDILNVRVAAAKHRRQLF